jgi:predicted HD superfamily hydrolase involved in NAD metabolism
MIDYDSIVEELEVEINQRFSGKPMARHIRSVADLAVSIAATHGRDETLLPQQARVAALAHDLYKKFPPNELRELIRRENVPIDEFSMNVGGGLLHAPPAAHYLRTRCGVRDENLLCAVYYHTTGRAGASLLEKILFCADYLDPSRELRGSEPDVITLGEKAKTDLDVVYREVLGRKLTYTLGKGMPLHPNGIAAWNEITGNKITAPGPSNL